MKDLLLLATLIYVMVLAGMGTLRGELLALGIPLLIYLGAGFLYGPAPLRLSVTRTLASDRVQEGKPVTVRLTVVNEGTWLECVRIEDLVPRLLGPVEGKTSVLGSLAPGATVDLSYTLMARRGHYTFSGVQVTASDRLGLFQRRGTLLTHDRLLVLPELAKLRRVAIRPRQTLAHSGPIPTRKGGPGVEFFGVRSYQQGDPLRWINWKASARHSRQFFTNEFEQEQVADVGLVLDVRRRVDIRAEGRSLFEPMVRATAALAEALLKDGNRVGLLLYGRALDWTFPGYGKAQRDRIMQVLARAEPGESMVFDRLDNIPTRLFRARSQLALVSPVFPDDLRPLLRLRAREYSLLVVSPDPVSFEEKALAWKREVALGARAARLERILLLRRLRQAGVVVLDWRVEMPFDHVFRVSLRGLPLWSRTLWVET